ncbi:MAG: hypothetical protein V3V05_01030 [Pontiella sp.]
MDVGGEKIILDVTMQKEMIEEFEKRAVSMHLFTAEYCELILANWLASDKGLELAEQ